MPVTGPTVVRRQLGRRLRALRAAAGVSVPEIGSYKIMSRSKLNRIENGARAVSVGDVWALCRIYRADDKATDELAAMASASDGQGWWEDYGDVMGAGFGLYLQLEETATGIRNYEAEFVHGLFQTADYARAVVRAELPDSRRDSVDRIVDLRLQRQQTIFQRQPPLAITAVLNAAVLARQVGTAAIMTSQARHLHELAALDSADVRVLPWEAGAHPAMVGSFTILEFEPPEDPTVVHADSYTGARYVEQAGQVGRLGEVFATIQQQSTPIEEYLS